MVLVTTTFSQTLGDYRAQLALKTCRTAKEHGYQIIVVDGSPSQEFKAALRETGAVVIDQVKPGMGQSRRECFFAGLQTSAQVIVWLEPEKWTLVPLLETSVHLVYQGNVDMVVPRRRNLDNYPRYQQWSEYAGNWQIGNILGRHDLDLYIGPRVMTRAETERMMSYTGQCGENVYGDNWEILFIPVLHSLHEGKKILSVLVDYVHPDEQKIEDTPEMMSKRDKQREDLVSTMDREARRIDFPRYAWS